MSRRFTFVTVALTAVVAFLIGAIVAGGVARSAVSAGAPARPATPRLASRNGPPALASLVNFADVVERINPAVVNIDTTTRGRDGKKRRKSGRPPDPAGPVEG